MKLLALDVDGTLVGTDLQISPRVQDAVARAQERGVDVTLVTGRMFQATIGFARQLHLKAPVICYQGAVICDPSTDEVLRHTALENETVLELVRFAKADGKHVQLYKNDRYYCEHENRFSDLYARLSGVRPIIVPSLEETFAFSDATKAVVIEDPPEAAKYIERLRLAFGERAYITRSYPEFIEVLNPAVDKGEALAFTAQRLGISLQDVVAVGDSWNDAPLLERAGVGIAMGSAPPELRAVANGIVADVAGDGVAEAIERYILQ